MSGLKSLVRPAVLGGVAKIAPITWRARPPGSLVVLMYHRVLPESSPARLTEQPAMYVSPETLDLHLAEVKRHFELVHLDDWLRRAKSGASLPHLACAITFDDGWRDNLEFALPVLQKHGAPAMIFLVSSYVGSAQRFWPNRLMALIDRAMSSPGSVEFPPPLRTLVEPVLAEATQLGELRSDAVGRAVERAKAFGDAEIRSWVAQAEESCRDGVGSRDTLNREEIAQMAATGLVRFGSHTATHRRLGGPEPADVLDREIADSKAQLQEICGQEIDVFCFPNGDTSPEAIQAARGHYLGAVTTRKGWHRTSSDPHLIRRIGLHERGSSSRDAFLARLSAWL